MQTKIEDFGNNKIGDQLAFIEHELRTTGKWADISGMEKISHYFMAKNPRINTAISICREIVVPFEKIREPLAERRCLVCQMWITAKEEVVNRQIDLLSQLDVELSTRPPIKKEQ